MNNYDDEKIAASVSQVITLLTVGSAATSNSCDHILVWSYLNQPVVTPYMKEVMGIVSKELEIPDLDQLIRFIEVQHDVLCVTRYRPVIYKSELYEHMRKHNMCLEC